jgi:hypothetical protein
MAIGLDSDTILDFDLDGLSDYLKHAKEDEARLFQLKDELHSKKKEAMRLNIAQYRISLEIREIKLRALEARDSKFYELVRSFKRQKGW